MGLFFNNSDDEPAPPTKTDHTVLPVSTAIRDTLMTGERSGDQAIRVRPFKNSRGIEDGKQFLKAIHDPLTDGKGRTTSPAHAFEMRFANDVLNFQYVPGDPEYTDSLLAQLQTSYPDSHFETGPAELVTAHEGEYVAGTTLTMRKPTLYPIEHIDLEGFDIDPFASITKEMVTDFSGELSDVVVQVMFRAAPRGWQDGIDEIARQITDTRTEKRRRLFTSYYEEIEPSAKDKKAAKMVRNLRGETGWEMNVRVFAVAGSPSNARDRVHKVAQMFGNYYESSTEQTFVPTALSEHDLTQLLEDAGSRTFVDQGMVHSRAEAAGLVHVPNDEINLNAVNWMVRRSDGGVPPTFPTFDDFDRTGYSELGYGRYPTSYEQYTDSDTEWPYAVDPVNPADDDGAQLIVSGHEFGFKATDGEIYAGVWPRKMVENAANPDVDQPLFIGVDEANGRPVPVLYEQLFRHVFGGGRTGEGKTTILMNLVNQLEESEDNAGACTFVSEEDLYQIAKLIEDLSPEDTAILEPQNEYSEYETGFNFLDTLHRPGEPGFVTESELLLGDLIPMVNAEEFVRIKGVISNMFRVVITLHNDPNHDGRYTPLDIRFMLEDPDEYLEFVKENGLTFLIPQAKKITTLDDQDLEPLTRRLQDWTEAGDMRTLTSTRESTLSIPEVVATGTDLFVNISNMKDETKKAVTTAITRKIWSTVTSRPGEVERRRQQRAGVTLPDVLRDRTQSGSDTLDDEQAELALEDDGTLATELRDAATDDAEAAFDPNDPTPERRDGEQFDAYVIGLDELHAILDDNSNLGSMLALARKKRLGIVLFTQQFGQLSKQQRRDIRGNCATLLAANPGNDPDELRELARSFRGLDQDDLQIDQFHAWTTITGPGGELSEPFVTRLFPPHPPRRDTDTMLDAIELIIEETGVPRMTDSERLASVPKRFRGLLDDLDDLDDTGDFSTIPNPDFYEAIYQVQIRRSDDPLDPGPIPFADVADAIRATVGRLTDHAEESIHDGQCQSIKDRLCREHLEEIHTTGEYAYRVLPDGQAFLDQGTGPDVGKEEHRRGVNAGYHHLTHCLPECRVSLPTQGGSEDKPDLRIHDPFEASGSALAIQRATQTFEDEYPLRSVLTGGSDTQAEMEHTTKHKADSLIGKVTRCYDADEACLFLTWSIDDARTVAGHLTTPDAQSRLPDHAHWNILVLPDDADGSDGDDELRYYIGADDDSTMPLSEVSTDAIEAAHTDDHSSLFGDDVPEF